MNIVDDLRDAASPRIRDPYEKERQYKREARLELGGILEKAADEIERLRKALREIYEVYANSEGIPQPMTAAEGYLLFLLKETAKIAQETLQEKE